MDMAARTALASLPAPQPDSGPMYTQSKPQQKPTAPVFMMANTPDPSTKFVAGQCVCKNCKSTELTFYNYLEDAKCSCGQWQNEDPIPD